MTTKTQNIITLKGVGPRLAERLGKLGISTIQDLLFHLPFRYQDRTKITPIKALQAGQSAQVQGRIIHHAIKFGRKRSLECTLEDDTGQIKLRFFYFHAGMQQQLTKTESEVRCFGEVRWLGKDLAIIHPEFQVLSDDLPLSQHLTPIYPTTEGISQNTWRKLLQQALHCLEKNSLVDFIAPELQVQLKLPGLHESLRFVHYPPTDAVMLELENGTHPSQQRLAFEELLAHQLSMRNLRAQLQQQPAAAMVANKTLLEQFRQQLEFELTNAQLRVKSEIAQDMAQTKPMLRLVQGDVGSGKTVVAAYAALLAIGNNKQVALMAPTELLAEQHYQNFCRWLKDLPVSMIWLTGSMSAMDRRENLAQLASGQAQLAIGTHALFQDKVEFKDLGLIIIDEQHRFGVSQRLALRKKATELVPHQLLMTATPIPRTLAMTVYSSLDCSTIDELPPGRQPVSTIVVNNTRRGEIIERVRGVCAQGGQAYWVCTLIEESENLPAQAALEMAKTLQQALPEIKVALVHGRMDAASKEKVMAEYKAGHCQLLVATTVIEVGVDVPNANLMIIENPERLGLAQLHQLRGRVGRGNQQSFCVLLYQAPLSEISQQRLDVLRQTHDGLVIAEQDLALRGPGEVLGTRQTGLMPLKIADLIRDQDLLEQVRMASTWLLQHDPGAVALIIERWIHHDLETVCG